MTTFNFALNRMCLPHRPPAEFLALARKAGAPGIELRNDLAGLEIGDGSDLKRVREQVEGAGLTIVSVNCLADFNVLTPSKLDEAEALFKSAAALGAPAVVLCPTFEPIYDWSAGEAQRNLRKALASLQPLLDKVGVKGLVEPLGMPHSTLNRQVHALEAVDGLTDGWESYGLLHDTFQFWRASDTEFFPDRISLVHVSGISNTHMARQDLREPDRGFVFVDDRSETVSQLNRLRAAGYRGWVSMEPFDPQVQQDPDIAGKLWASFGFLEAVCAPALA